MKKHELAQKMSFKRLPYWEYQKLNPKAMEAYNKQEQEANFERKMRRKGYGNSVERGSKRLEKFFGGL